MWGPVAHVHPQSPCPPWQEPEEIKASGESPGDPFGEDFFRKRMGRWELFNVTMDWLVVWNFLYFFHILGWIILIDVHIFQRGSNHQPVDVSWCLMMFLHDRFWWQFSWVEPWQTESSRFMLTIRRIRLTTPLFIRIICWPSNHWGTYASLKHTLVLIRQMLTSKIKTCTGILEYLWTNSCFFPGAHVLEKKQIGVLEIGLIWHNFAVKFQLKQHPWRFAGG